jgi:hypothetical protein
MSITPEQLEELAQAHIDRILLHTSEEELKKLARQALEWKLQCPMGHGFYDHSLLAEDIVEQEDDDMDAASEFIAGLGWTPEQIDEFLEP